MFASIEQARDLGAVAVGATIYFGSDESTRQIIEVSEAFNIAHEMGMATILWCYLRNSAFKTGGVDYHTSADLTGQANHLGVTIQADIIKQKLPECNGGYNALNEGGTSYGKTHKKVYSDLSSDHPIDLTRLQVIKLLYGKGWAYQLRRCFRRERSCPGGKNCGYQQTCWRNGTYQRTKSLPETYGCRY